MEYTNYLTDEFGAESKNRQITHRLVRNNKVIAFLKQRGYKIVHFSSGWNETSHNEYADVNVDCGQGNEFLQLVVQTTMLNCFEQSILGNDARKRVLDTFTKLSEVSEARGPKFVFAHILKPHPPYLFDDKGYPVSDTELKMCGRVWLQKRHYLNQLAFINGKVEVLVDQILRRSKTPPVIILQADHGSASLISKDNSRHWKDPSDKMLEERMRIFSAFHLPNDDRQIYDSITPVNNFRVIFNTYFDAKYELLDDQNFFSTYQRPFHLRNVTERVKSAP